MKKLLRVVSIILVGIFLVYALTGCQILETLNESKARNRVAAVLKERYGEEFVVKDVWGFSGKGFKGLAHPKRDKTLLFEGLYNLEESSYTYDRYDQAIIAKQLKEIVQADLEALFGECYINATMMGGASKITTVEDITIENYAAISETPRVYFEIGINTQSYSEISFEKEYKTLLKTMSKLNLLGYETTNSIYFLTESNYEMYSLYFETQNQSSTDFKEIIEACPQIGIPVIDEKSRISIEEYISERKGLPK